MDGKNKNKILYYNIENMNDLEEFRGHHYHHHTNYLRNNHVSMNYLILFLAIFMFFTSLMILLLRKV